MSQESTQEMLGRWDAEDAASIKNAILEERERCAKVAEEYSKICQAMPTSVIDSVCRGIAAAIRRGAND